MYIESAEVADFEARNAHFFTDSIQISVVTIDDERVESNESVVVQFVHIFPPYIANFLEIQGEFLRNTTTVVIIDNDCEFGWM